MYKINEIFYSIQGEGHNTGLPVIFIRFAGCNLSCWFCDTDFSVKHHYTLPELLTEVKKYNCMNIVLTGGEPTLQVNKELLVELHSLGYYICVETNGTQPLIDGYDFITVSPKEGKRVKVYSGDELKLVYTNQEDNLLDLFEAFGSFKHYYLQPCYLSDGESNVNDVIEKIKERKIWKLSLQTQKMLNIR